jgi:putative aldouronate transport system permease protein
MEASGVRTLSSAFQIYPPVLSKKNTKLRRMLKNVSQMKLLYLFLLFPMAAMVIFHYLPIYGILIAFKDYRYADGILGSPWNGFAHFQKLFQSMYFPRILRNTVEISVLRLLFGFPAPILLALLINEVRHMGFKRVVQSISYLPHFLSWVIVAGILTEFLSPQRGIIGAVFALWGQEAPIILTNKAFFRPLLIVSGIWKEVGYGTIIYLATISSIDPELYESASIDGANRFQKARFISIPSLLPIVTVLLILNLGGILNAGFDQIFNLYNPLVYEVADIIDTYVYRVGILERSYDFSTAVGLFKNLVGVVLIVGTNMITRRFSDYGMW